MCSAISEGTSNQRCVPDPPEDDKNEVIDSATRMRKLKRKEPVARRKSLRNSVREAEQRPSDTATSSEISVKVEVEEAEDHDEEISGDKTCPGARKRGRPAKSLVGAAKRKAKTSRVVKKCSERKDAAADDDCDEKKDDDDGTEADGSSEQSSIFRWECHVCREVLRNWYCLSVHCRTKHKTGAEVYCVCAKVLTSRTSIIKHRLKHTNAYKYRCEKCDKAFHRKALLDLHVLSHVPKEEQPFVCCKCARRFHSEALLRQHERVHLPKEERLIYPCTVCLKKFSSKAAVTYHLKAVHSGERPFICDQCGHSFTSKGILQEHLTIHSDETPFKCTQCRKSFKTKYRLKIHMDTHREIPYQCPVCPLQLSTRRTLRMHLVVHRDTKAYQCATCGKAFRRAKDLKNHHNLHTGRRPYTCTFCPRTFANGSNCRAHKRKMHPEELRIYEAALAAAENDGTANPASIAWNAVKMAAANKKPLEEQKPCVDNHSETSPDDPQTSSIIEKHSIFGSSVESCNLLATRRANAQVYGDHLQGDSKYVDSPINVSENCAAPSNEHLHSVSNIDLIANMNHSLLPNRNQQLYNRLGQNVASPVVLPMDLNTSRRNEQLVNSGHSAPLNLNVAEMHSLNRQQQQQHGGLEMEDPSYLSRSFPGRHLNSNIQLHRQQQHQSLNSRLHHQQQQPGEFHGYQNFYQHPVDSMPSVIAHTGSMGVPAFPGNPYIHHNMGYGREASNI